MNKTEALIMQRFLLMRKIRKRLLKLYRAEHRMRRVPALTNDFRTSDICRQLRFSRPNYSAGARVVFGQNEHFISAMDGGLSKRVTDSAFVDYGRIRNSERKISH